MLLKKVESSLFYPFYRETNSYINIYTHQENILFYSYAIFMPYD
jgi:hypothetical protein